MIVVESHPPAADVSGRGRILHEARLLFTAQGYAAVSMQQIADDGRQRRADDALVERGQQDSGHEPEQHDDDLLVRQVVVLVWRGAAPAWDSMINDRTGSL